MSPQRRPPRECPVCGEDVPPRASACPHCGADERTGWNEAETYLDGVDLPDEPPAASGAHSPRRHPLPRPNGMAFHWWLVGLALLALLIYRFVAPLLSRN